MYVKGIKYVKDLDLSPHQRAGDPIQQTILNSLRFLHQRSSQFPLQEMMSVLLDRWITCKGHRPRLAHPLIFVSAFCTETMSAGSGLAGATGGRQASPTHLNSPTLLPKSWPLWWIGNKNSSKNHSMGQVRRDHSVLFWGFYLFGFGVFLWVFLCVVCLFGFGFGLGFFFFLNS